MRISYIDAGIQTISLSTIVEINRKKATHANFHSNRINTLDIRIPTQQQYHCNKNNKDEEYIRSGGCINHLLELDFSSNLLGDGYNNTTMPILGMSKKLSFLGLCNNLRKLNLSTNNLNEKSFVNLSDGIRLPNLQTIDISQNNFNKLPTKLHVLFPSLKHLSAKKNEIKSLTSLLQTLHNHRGKLETAVLTNNPVCAKELYFEKVVFVLGTTLSSLDCRKVTSSDRESARIRLERGLSMKNTVTVPKQECIPPTISRRNRVLVQEADNSDQIEHDQREWYQEKENEQHPQHDDTAVANEDLRTLKERVASLSARIEEQASSQRHNKENVPPKASKPKSDRMKMPDSNNKELCIRQQKAATYLMNTMILRQKHDQTILRFAFSLWRLSTKLEHEKKMKANCIEAERKWQVKAEEQEKTNKSLSNELEKLKQSAQLSDKVTKVCDKKMIQLKQQVYGLRESLKTAKTNQEQSNGMLDTSKADVQRLEVALQREREDNKAEGRRVKHNLDTLSKELEHTAQKLDKERRERTVVESKNKQISIANKEAAEVANTNAQQLHKLKLEVIHKEATIQRLKDSYKQAARKAALDKARCGQLSSSEQEARELVDQQTNKMRNMVAENERLVSDYKALHNNKLDEITSKETKINTLTSLVEEKDMAINASEMRIKSIISERDDMQRQLSRSKQRVNQLQAQLDQAVNDIRNVNRSSVDKEERLEAEVSRASELQYSLVSLEAKQKDMQRDNMLLRNEVAKHQQMSTSLKKKVQQAKSQWKSREKEIASSHYEEMQQLRDEHEQALLSVNRKFENERSIRLEAEQKAAVLKAEVGKQKLKMQSAIEGLARQLTE